MAPVKIRCEGGHLENASEYDLFLVFQKYASVEINGEKFMTASDFICNYLAILPEGCDIQTVRLLAGTPSDEHISFRTFVNFERMLTKPDALHRLAMRIFDPTEKEKITFRDFVDVMAHTESNQVLPFDKDSRVIDMYFGNLKERAIRYPQFAQFLRDFQDDYYVHCFVQRDRTLTGYITFRDFVEIMLRTRTNAISEKVQEYFVETLKETPNITVEYPFYKAFHNTLSNMELVKRIYLTASHGSRQAEISKDQMMHVSQAMSRITQIELDVLFRICKRDTKSGTIDFDDLQDIAPYQVVYTREIAAVSNLEGASKWIRAMAITYRYFLAATAGCIGALCVYPVDLVKTRMQNQRISGLSGDAMYKNSFHCFYKVLTLEGFRGLYRGILPQLVGICPEKATKLTVNDLMRQQLADEKGHLTITKEVIAGGSAGLSQVIFTNPLEITKIHLQVAGLHNKPVRAMSIVRRLGLRGLYKGVGACIIRDIGFSAIYFPFYANLKIFLADDTGFNNSGSLFTAGLISTIPAAFFMTPADVVKTRLQVDPQPGQTVYNKGILDCAGKIMREEGPTAFFKGGFARVCRSSPQFAIMLLSYEMLQRYLYIDFGKYSMGRSSGSVAQVPPGMEFEMEVTNPDHIGGYAVAVPLFEKLQTRFGICLPHQCGSLLNMTELWKLNG